MNDNDNAENTMNDNFHPQSDEERELLAELDLEPADWSLVSARISEWERPDGQVLRARSVSIRPRHPDDMMAVATTRETT